MTSDTHRLRDCSDTHLNRAWWASWHPASPKGTTTLTLSSDIWHIGLTWCWHSRRFASDMNTHSLWQPHTHVKHRLYAPINDALTYSLMLTTWVDMLYCTYTVRVRGLIFRQADRMLLRVNSSCLSFWTPSPTTEEFFLDFFVNRQTLKIQLLINAKVVYLLTTGLHNCIKTSEQLCVIHFIFHSVCIQHSKH